MLIGLCGAAGCGKSTVSKHLYEKYRFFDFALADPIYDMVAALTGLTKDTLKQRDVKEARLEWLGLSPRELLQRIGTEFGRRVIDDGVWIRHLMRRIDATAAAVDRMSLGGTKSHFVISDVRFDNEAEAIMGRGGEVWRVVRDSESCLAAGAAQHESEGGISASYISRTLVNNGTVEDLLGRVDAVMQEATESYN